MTQRHEFVEAVNGYGIVRITAPFGAAYEIYEWMGRDDSGKEQWRRLANYDWIKKGENPFVEFLSASSARERAMHLQHGGAPDAT